MLRICAGKFKGKRLILPPSVITRPSSNRLREAIFNILTNTIDFSNMRVLDGFAGSGALGLEALSRGVAEVIFCEKDPLAQRVLNDNILNMGSSIKNQVEVISDLFRLRGAMPFDLIFLDPPYDQDLEFEALQYLTNQKLVTAGGIVIVEQRKGGVIAESEDFTIQPPRIYGQSQVTFLRALKH